MKINANEMLLINKNLKFKGDEAEKTGSAVALAEVPESEKSISALNAQSMNNIAFQGVNMAALKKMGLNSMIALTMLGGAASMTSCSDDDPEIIEMPATPPQVTINIVNNVKISVTVNMTEEELVTSILAEQQRLIALIEQMHKDQQANHAEQMEINKAILAELVKQGISMDRIVALLEKMNMTAEDLLNYAKENSEMQTEIINTITQGNAEQKAILLEILESIKDGNKINSENNVTLTKLFVMMSQTDHNDEAIVKILNNILNKVNESIKTNVAIAKQQSMLMQAIIGKLDKINNSMKQGLLNIINKIDSVSEAHIALLTKIFVSIEEGQDNTETNKLLQAIFDKVQESIDNNKEFNKQINELLSSILDKMSEMTDEMKSSVLAILSKIDSVSEANLKLINKVFVSIEEGKNNEKTNELLQAILDKVEESIKQNKEMDARTHKLLSLVLDKISKLDDSVKAGFLAVISNINSASESQVDLLIQLINKVDNLNGIGGDNESVKEVLNAILAKIQEFIDAHKEMDSKTEQLIQTIINNIENFGGDLDAAIAKILAKMDQISAEHKAMLDEILDNSKNMNENMQAGFAEVIENLKNMSAADKAFYQEVLDRMDKLDDNAQNGLALLLEAIANGNQISANILAKIDSVLAKLDTSSAADLKFYNEAIALLAELSSKLDQLGDKSDNILEVVTNISLDAGASFEDIKEMLAAIKDQTKANGDILTSIESKLNLVAITLEGIKTQVEGLSGDHTKLLNKLDEILAKIPEGCKCEKIDLQPILDKLDALIKSIEENIGNHEGILDDLDKEFGM